MLREILKKLFYKNARRTALYIDNQAFSYAALYSRINSMTNYFLKAGLGQNSRIVYVACAGHVYIEALFASMQIGAVFHPISSQLEPNQFLDNIIKINPDLIILDRATLLAVEEKISALLPRQRIVVYPSNHRYLSYNSLVRWPNQLRDLNETCEVDRSAPLIGLLDEPNHIIRYISCGQICTYIDHVLQEMLHPPGNAMICIPFTCRAYIQEILLAICCGDLLLPFESFHPKDFILTVGKEKVSSVFLTPNIIDAISVDSAYLKGDFYSLRTVRIGQMYFNRTTAKNLKSMLSPDCLIEKHTGFPSVFFRLSIHPDAIDLDDWNATDAVLNSVGHPLMEIHAGDNADTDDPTSYFRRFLFVDENQAQISPDFWGWQDAQGRYFLKWETESHKPDENSPLADIETGFSNKTPPSVYIPSCSVQELIMQHNYFLNVVVHSSQEDFTQQCCQVFLRHFPCNAAALQLQQLDNFQEHIKRTVVIREIEHTAIALPLPNAYFFNADNSIRQTSIHSPDFPKGLHAVCHPLYSSDYQLIGELHLVYGNDSSLSDEATCNLAIALSQLAQLVEIHQRHEMIDTYMELYKNALDLASDGIGISGLKAKPMVLYANKKSASYIRLGKESSEFGKQLEHIQSANLQDLWQGAKSVSRTFIFNDHVGGKHWVNYRTECICIKGINYAVTFSNMQSEEVDIQHLANLLTDRELEIVQLIALGQTNKEIASNTGVSANTIKYHISHIYKKLDVRNRTELLSKIVL